MRGGIQYTYMLLYCIEFLLGSALGYFIEFAYLRAKKSPPIRGLLYPLPLKPMYGFGAIFAVSIAPLLQKLPLPVAWLALSVLLGLYEVAGGIASERILKRRLWSYQSSFLNMRGYSDAIHAAIWGALGLIFIYCVNSMVTIM